MKYLLLLLPLLLLTGCAGKEITQNPLEDCWMILSSVPPREVKCGEYYIGYTTLENDNHELKEPEVGEFTLLGGL